MLIKRAFLLVPKFNHTLCKDADAIYSVGGRKNLDDEFVDCADCEKYEMANDKWI